MHFFSDKVLITPFSRTVIPPPYSAYQLQQSTSVNQIAFLPTSDSCAVAILLQNDQLAIYDYGKNHGDKVDDSVQMGVAGGPGFKVCCQTPTARGVYR